jgi:hypothetical protein
VPFDLGDTVRLQATCTDPGGVPATAGTALLTVTLPDGTTTTPVVPVPATTGQYTVDYATTQAGRHAVRWLFTTPASAFTDAFDVREESPRSLFSLQVAKGHLRLLGDDSKDESVRYWTEATTLGVESLAGACVRRQVTETHRLQPSGVTELALRTTPVLDLVSIAVLGDGTAPAPAVEDLDVDEYGILTRLDGGRLNGRLRITTAVGRLVIPANISLAGMLILQHLWRTQMGGSRALVNIGGADDYAVSEPVPGFGYAIPNRALQLLEPDRSVEVG